ncbi:hypothetical protein M9H77_34483 [Catharanthus roseus]|uniref:Uncharacterized protein n=1 Tax=Catharanthus roseus TaxID=4058 RepID=A0ACB9ZM06_CATRO|nr:hypothetical protein M9H77_34483 [Catharanthus roseus]
MSKGLELGYFLEGWVRRGSPARVVEKSKVRTVCFGVQTDKQLMLQTRIRSAEGTTEANMERGQKRYYCNIFNLKYSPIVNCKVQKQTSGTNGITNDQYMDYITVGNNFKRQTFTWSDVTARLYSWSIVFRTCRIPMLNLLT